MPDIIFYQVNGTCANAAHGLLKELEIPFKRVAMGRSPEGFFTAAEGSFSREWYLKNVHHMGLVPALVINDKNLTENPAALAYIASLKPERKMLGATDWERAKVLEWLARLSGTLHGNGVAAAIRPYRFTDEESAFPGIKKKGMEKVANFIETIDAKVDGAHAVGEQVTVVDFFSHVIWRWAANLQVDRSKYPRFREVARNVERSQGMEGALVDEKLPLEFPENASM